MIINSVLTIFAKAKLPNSDIYNEVGIFWRMS